MAKEDHNWVGIGIAAALILIGIAAVVGAYRYGFAGIGQFASSIFWWAIGILFFFFIIRWCLFGGVFAQGLSTRENTGTCAMTRHIIY